MKYLYPLIALVLIYTLDSCCKGCPVNNTDIIILFKNFNPAEADSFTIQPYVKGSNFETKTGNIKTKPIQEYGVIHDYRINIDTADWELVVHGTNKTYRFNNARYSMETCRSCGKKQKYIRLYSFLVNGRVQEGGKYVLVK